MKNPKLVLATKPQAEKMTAKVVAHVKAMETSWWELGRLVNDCLSQRVPAALGMNAHDWMAKVTQGSTSKAWRALRISRALQGVPQRDVKQLSEGNAFSLSRLPQKQRESREWVKKAVELPNEKFQDAVESHIEAKTGVRRQEFVSTRISLPRDIFEQWESAVKKMAGVLGIDIETNPGNRIQVYEAFAVLINLTPEEVLKSEVVGSLEEK